MAGTKRGMPFERTGPFPIDDKFVLSNEEMLAVDDQKMPEKYFAVNTDDGKFYLYDKSATASAETGKYSVVEGGGGGHVELTQAEYNALSYDEKHNGKVYFITDGEGGGGSTGIYVLTAGYGYEEVLSAVWAAEKGTPVYYDDPDNNIRMTPVIKIQREQGAHQQLIVAYFFTSPTTVRGLGYGYSEVKDVTYNISRDGLPEFFVEEQDRVTNITDNTYYMSFWETDYGMDISTVSPGTYMSGAALASKDYVDTQLAVKLMPYYVRSHVLNSNIPAFYNILRGGVGTKISYSIPDDLQGKYVPAGIISWDAYDSNNSPMYILPMRTYIPATNDRIDVWFAYVAGNASSEDTKAPSRLLVNVMYVRIA